MSDLPLPEQFGSSHREPPATGPPPMTPSPRRGRDPEVLALIGEAPIRQRRPNLLLAAAHFLSSWRLGIPWLPTTARWGGSPVIEGRNSVGDVVVDFEISLGHRTELLELLAVRTAEPTRWGAAPPCAWVQCHCGRLSATVSLCRCSTWCVGRISLLFDATVHLHRGGRTAVSAGRPARGPGAPRVRRTRSPRGAAFARTSPAIATRTGINSGTD